ncbi:MAG: leucyl aminopeptidase [Ignavibacteria bacterium]
MIFKLSIKSGSKEISYKPLSLSIKYLIDNNKLKTNLASIEKIFNVRLSDLQRKTFLSKDNAEIKISKHDGKPDEVCIIKVKIDEKFSPDYFRNHLAGFISSLGKEEVNNLHIFIPDYTIFSKFFYKAEYYYQTFAEGVYFGNYTFNDYLSEKKEPKDLRVNFYADNEEKLEKALANASVVMNSVYFVRKLQNEPGIVLTPAELANRIKAVLVKEKIKVKIFDEKEIKERKMGGLLAVGMGSDNPPRFIVAEYNGAGKSRKGKYKKIALVGKGITFDSGGISIKPSAKMGEMKADMSGAAVVAGTLLAASQAKLPFDLIGIMPSAENMPSGKSFRPGDIIITSSGKSIDVDDTDAEGRIILADALTYASKLKPDLIIDLATLTGACVVALGEFVGGLFTKNEELSNLLFEAGIKTHDRLWPMPMWDDFHKANKSDVADVKNYGGRWGGAIHAAKFLENFVDKKIPWAHLDIAGPAFANDYNNYTKKYMTGFGVRLLFEFLKTL